MLLKRTITAFPEECTIRCNPKVVITYPHSDTLFVFFFYLKVIATALPMSVPKHYTKTCYTVIPNSNITIS